MEEERQAQETAADIRKLYEQTKAQTARPSAKRQKVVPVESQDSSVDPDLPPPIGQADAHRGDEGMNVDEDDPVQMTLKRAARAKREGKSQTQAQLQASMPPPAQVRRMRSPSEEQEVVEESARSKPSKRTSPTKSKPPPPVTPKTPTQALSSTQVTKDEAFLQAITKASKSKKAVDELDKEFNQLRIPKPGASTGSTVVKANVWDANHPDYTIVNDFDDDMTGNFIQIVRKDLYRKDLGKKKGTVVDDGLPNFKKFKKVSAVALILAQTDQTRRRMYRDGNRLRSC